MTGMYGPFVGTRDRRNAMVVKFGIAAVLVAVIALSAAALAQQTGGTAAEAQAMLIKAIAAGKGDKAKRSTCSTREKADFGIETFTCFVQMLATARSLQLAMPTS